MIAETRNDDVIAEARSLIHSSTYLVPALNGDRLLYRSPECEHIRVQIVITGKSFTEFAQKAHNLGGTSRTFTSRANCLRWCLFETFPNLFFLLGRGAFVCFSLARIVRCMKT